MSLTKTFNAIVTYQLHKNPAILGLYSETLGHGEVDLADLSLSAQEIEALHAASKVTGTYESLASPLEIYHPIKGWKQVTWKVTSLKAAA